MTRSPLELRAFAALTLLACTLSTPAAWPAAAKPPAEQAPLETLVVSAESTPTERLLDGTIEAVNQATVSAQTAGRVTEVLFDVNDVVPAGALIVRIRSTEQVAGLSQAQAALKEATAREAEAQTRYERIRDMYQRRVVAKATFDEAICWSL
jgi:multidrug efflux pump subunit AcrA (membrane-fusion protein)